MTKLVIFGAGMIAEVVRYFFDEEKCISGETFEVVAHCVDGAYVTGEPFLGKPVVAFEDVEKLYPPEDHKMFVALGYYQMNMIRAAKIEEVKAKGYRLASFVHEDSGKPLKGAYGENTLIMEKVCLQPYSTIGNDVFIWSGTCIGHHGTVGDHCWFSGGTVAGCVTMGEGCFVACEAMVGQLLTVGRECFIGAGTLVTGNLPDYSVVAEKASPILKMKSDRFMRVARFR